MSYKALELSLELSDELRKRVSDYARILDGFDSSSPPNPTIALDDGTPATTEDAVFIRIMPRDWSLTKDVLGLAQTVYTPHTIQLAVEGPASGAGLGRFVSAIHLFAILTTCSKRGTRLEYWEETNGTAPSVTTFNTGSKLITSIEPELYYPLLASQ